MPEAENLALARQSLAAINAHDIDAYLKNVDDSFVQESEIMGVIRGRDGVRQALTVFLAAFPDIHFEAEEMLATGNHVIIRMLWSGTHSGPFAGVPATNKKITWRSCNLVEFGSHGKAIWNRIYADNIGLLRQLGVLPAAQSTATG
jgi:steroid delta-isomerase-like uncharacterized protein